MLDPGDSRDVSELITGACADAQLYSNTVSHFGADAPQVEAHVEFGLPFSSLAANTRDGLEELRSYRCQIDNGTGAAWMDNTTLVTAARVISGDGPEFITPLTLWDLAAFTNAVVGYERIYHHQHPGVIDAEFNRRLGAEVLRSIPVPLQAEGASTILPERWEGPHRFMSDIWDDAFLWLKRLARSVGKPTLDGVQLEAVREAWALALDRDDVSTHEIVDWEEADRTWNSPSDLRLRQMVGVTSAGDSVALLDTNSAMQAQWLAAGANENERGRLLTDFNLRSYINQRIADFFELAYVPAAGRVPFRRHLYNRAAAVQRRLTAVSLLDDSYATLAGDVRLRLPVLLALAIRQAEAPEDLWEALGQLRADAEPYRAVRSQLDASLARRDLKEAAQVAKALTSNVESVLAVAGKAVAASGLATVGQLATGDVNEVSMAVAAIQAAGERLLDSSLVDRLLWRLRRPHLLWLNDTMEEAKSLTEALPDFARIWKLPEREQGIFAERFGRMGQLQAVG